MKQININVVGDSDGDVPVLVGDDGTNQRGLISGQRGVFVLLDKANGGATIAYAGGSKTVRVIIPPHAGTYEANLPPVKPPEEQGELALFYAPPVQAGFSVESDHFLRGGEPWLMRGATEFRALQLWQADRGRLEGLVAQRKAAGANLLRFLGMKENNTGWSLDPVPDDVADGFMAWLGQQGLCGLFTVFADTRTKMSRQGDQINFWEAKKAVASRHPHVLLQLANEWNHPTQSIDPMAFAKPTANLGCRGSGLTDAPPAMPFRSNPQAWDTSTRWDFACYHARRDGLPDARGITNYGCYEFIANYPEPCPLVPAEGMKPEDYGWRNDVASQQGRRSRLGAGGIFHTGQGVNGDLWGGAEESCARAFYAG